MDFIFSTVSFLTAVCARALTLASRTLQARLRAFLDSMCAKVSGNYAQGHILEAMSAVLTIVRVAIVTAVIACEKQRQV